MEAGKGGRKKPFVLRRLSEQFWRELLSDMVYAGEKRHRKRCRRFNSGLVTDLEIAPTVYPHNPAHELIFFCLVFLLFTVIFHCLFVRFQTQAFGDTGSSTHSKVFGCLSLLLLAASYVIYRRDQFGDEWLGEVEVFWRTRVVERYCRVHGWWG